MRLFTPLLTTAALTASAALTVTPLVSPAFAQTAQPGALPYSASTGVGVHNAYEQGTFPYLADALDSGASMLEIDVWTNNFASGWRVSHENPLGNKNNCTAAATPEELRANPRDQAFDGCLADLRTWSEANPGHRPILLKVEMKDGFNASNGRGPAEFDALVREQLGDALYGPGQLAGPGQTLDDAVQSDGWPSRDELAGKFLIHLIPGTVEENNPVDKLWTDREYATHLRDQSGQGALDQTTAFPAVHHAEPGDPRATRYEDETLRPWFVVFDGDASAYADGSIDTSWYAERNYLLVMSSAHAVAPAIDAREPSQEEASDRVTLLAEANASQVSSDWAGLPEVLSTVLPRG